MKRSGTLLMAAASFMLLSSCHKELITATGEDVRFAASSVFSETRASYSGSTTTIANIDFDKDDQISIYCEAASEPSTHLADYNIKEVKEDGNASKAVIEVSSGVGLRWGAADTDHIFYGVFPAAGTGVTKSITANSVSASLSSEQGGKLDGTTVKPDMTNVLMTAKSGKCRPGKIGDVFLRFIPLVTAIEFTVTNGTSADMSLTSVELSSASKALCGDFSVDMDATGVKKDDKRYSLDSTSSATYLQTYPLVSSSASYSAATGKVSIDLKSANNGSAITLAPDTKLTFTFFIKPGEDLEDLSFKFIKSDDSWLSTRLGYTNGSGMFFPQLKKTRVTGFVLPSGAQWTIEYSKETVVTNWDTSAESTPIDVTIG